jgi:hypothetical protein
MAPRSSARRFLRHEALERDGDLRRRIGTHAEGAAPIEQPREPAALLLDDVARTRGRSARSPPRAGSARRPTRKGSSAAATSSSSTFSPIMMLGAVASGKRTPAPSPSRPRRSPATASSSGRERDLGSLVLGLDPVDRSLFREEMTSHSIRADYTNRGRLRSQGRGTGVAARSGRSGGIVGSAPCC